MTSSTLRRYCRLAVALVLLAVWLYAIFRHADPDPDALTSAVRAMGKDQIGAYLLLLLLACTGAAVMVDHFVCTADTAFRLRGAQLAQTVVLLTAALWIGGLVIGALFGTALFVILLGAAASYTTRNALENRLDNPTEGAPEHAQ